jgi:hypothetical protein
MVVRAKTGLKARRVAAIKARDEGTGAWLNHDRSTCVELVLDGDEEVVLIDGVDG